jgi:hypothetical protein
VGGLIPHLVEDAVAILQYVDDNVLFMEHNLEKTISMKTILLILKQLSILKILFHQSDKICVEKVWHLFSDALAEPFFFFEKKQKVICQIN